VATGSLAALRASQRADEDMRRMSAGARDHAALTPK
jgi:hypothetical protein